MSFSKLRIFTLIALGLIALSACSIGGSSNDTPSSSATGSVPTIKTPSSSDGTASAATGTPEDGISLDPPVLVAHATSGTQKGNFGTFYWMISNGLAAQVNARGIQIQDKSLHVTKDETVKFTWENQNSQSDSTLQSLKIAIFPEADSIMTAPSAQGNMKGFKASANPVSSDSLSLTDPSWKVGVDSGSYFVQVVADWSNPIVSGGKTRQCEYGFYITVG